MATFLFWNMNRKPLDDTVFRLAELHQVDILMLAECPVSAGAMLVSLNRDDGEWEFAAPDLELGTPKTLIFVRFQNERCVERLAAPRWTIREISWPNSPSILLTVVHLPSKWNTDAQSQAFGCVELAAAIRNVEVRVGHQRSLVVGDFNMNPFDIGMLSANGLHAEASRQIAATGSRKVGEITYHYFYNPM